MILSIKLGCNHFKQTFIVPLKRDCSSPCDLSPPFSGHTHFLTPVSFAQVAYFMFQEQLETSRREMIGLQERDRQLQCKNRNLHQLLKNEKDEVSCLFPYVRSAVGF